jgi:hypothetical protein
MFLFPRTLETLETHAQFTTMAVSCNSVLLPIQSYRVLEHNRLFIAGFST